MSLFVSHCCQQRWVDWRVKEQTMEGKAHPSGSSLWLANSISWFESTYSLTWTQEPAAPWVENRRVRLGGGAGSGAAKGLSGLVDMRLLEAVIGIEMLEGISQPPLHVNEGVGRRSGL